MSMGKQRRLATEAMGLGLGVLAVVVGTGCPVENRQDPRPTSVEVAPSGDEAGPVRRATETHPTRESLPPTDGAQRADDGADHQPTTSGDEPAPDDGLPPAPHGTEAASGDDPPDTDAEPRAPREHQLANTDIEPLPEDPPRPAPTTLEGDDSDAHTKPARRLRGPSVDPIKANGPIFEGWPKPKVALVISGEQIGFLEPCGCAGLENQKGGLKRRHTLLTQLEQAGWPLLMMDLGGQVRRFGPQAVIKFRKATESLTRIGYRAIGFGPQDLRLPVEELVYVATNLPDGKNPFVSANVGLLGLPSDFSARLTVAEIDGLRFGITSILGSSFQRQLHNDDIELVAAAEALAQVVPELRAQADFLILLSHANISESTALAQQFPDFHIVVTAGGADEPPNRMIQIEGTPSWLVEVGRKGMYVAVIGLYDDPQEPFRYQRVPLDARFPDSPAMQAMMVDYQRELATLGLDGLGLRPVAHPSGGEFIGSHRCVECHSEAAAVWENTPHAHATETLVNLTPARHQDPECISCHVVGWESQKYFPFESGYLDRTQTSHLQNVGCENCHGPGADHVAAEEGDVDVDNGRLEQLRKQIRVRLLDGEAEGKVVEGKVVQGPATLKCYECHDLDNSPDFDFVKYWPEVEHYGME